MPDSTHHQIVTRVFNAPRALVFKAWTEPDRFAKWWGPAGVEITVARFDLRPGGECLYMMRGPNNSEMWGKFIYREIAPPERLVFVNAFADSTGATVRGPYFAVWPLEILNTLTLTEENGKTTLAIHGGPINATAEEIAAFEQMTEGMRKGFGGTFAQLDAYLAGELQA